MDSKEPSTSIEIYSINFKILLSHISKEDLSNFKLINFWNCFNNYNVSLFKPYSYILTLSASKTTNLNLSSS